MQPLKPTFSIDVDDQRCEVHFSASGLWDMEKLVDFQRDLIAKSRPFFSAGRKIRVLGDLRGFVTQTREVAQAIRIIVEESAKLGTERTAIISDSVLMAMQYRRINEGVVCEIFENTSDALVWLRADSTPDKSAHALTGQ